MAQGSSPFKPIVLDSDDDEILAPFTLRSSSKERAVPSASSSSVHSVNRQHRASTRHSSVKTEGTSAQRKPLVSKNEHVNKLGPVTPKQPTQPFKVEPKSNTRNVPSSSTVHPKRDIADRPENSSSAELGTPGPNTATAPHHPTSKYRSPSPSPQSKQTVSQPSSSRLHFASIKPEVEQNVSDHLHQPSAANPVNQPAETDPRAEADESDASAGSESSYHSAHPFDSDTNVAEGGVTLATHTPTDPAQPVASSSKLQLPAVLPPPPADPQAEEAPQQPLLLWHLPSLHPDHPPGAQSSAVHPDVKRWAAALFHRLCENASRVVFPPIQPVIQPDGRAQAPELTTQAHAWGAYEMAMMRPAQILPANLDYALSPSYILATLQSLAAYITNGHAMFRHPNDVRHEVHLAREIDAVYQNLTRQTQQYVVSLLAGAEMAVKDNEPHNPAFGAPQMAAQLVDTVAGQDVASLAHMLSSDKIAVAEMANLQPCSDEALRDLGKAGLKTPLKSHQSSGLKFLVDAEHRKLPQVPEDGEVCLWSVRRTAQGKRLHSRSESQWQYNIPAFVPRGAILADAMGLGKTLTILSLILTPRDGGNIVDPKLKPIQDIPALSPSDGNSASPSSRKKRAAPNEPAQKHQRPTKTARAKYFADSDEDDTDVIWSSDEELSKVPSRATSADGCNSSRPAFPTLICCPVSLISNWTEQADFHTANPKMRYAVLYGKDAQTLQRKRDWNCYDFVVTSYDWIKNAYKDIGLFEQCKQNVKRHAEKILDLRAQVENVRQDVTPELGGGRMEHRRHKLARMIKELEELENETKAQFVMCPRRNAQRLQEQYSECYARAEQLPPRTPDVFENYTEAELFFIWTGQKKAPSMEWRRIFDQPWLRIVLDEAHVIRSFKTQVHEAIKALRAERKIAVTGTPIINSTLDFGALVSFIGVQPYNLDVGSSLWKSDVEGGFKYRCSQAVGIMRSLTKSLVILRTKEMKVNGAPLVELPPITLNRYEVEMRPADMEYYEECEAKLRQMVLRWAEDNEMGGKQSCILVFLQRMRQLANDRRLVPSDLVAAMENLALPLAPDGSTQRDESLTLTAKQITSLQAVLAAAVENEEDCAICYDALSNTEDDGQAIILYCGHCYHKQCIQKSLEAHAKCPYDQRPVSKNTRMIELSEEVIDDSAPASASLDGEDGAKINAVAEIVESIRAANPEDKILIFSNFVGLLRLVGLRLRAEGVPYATFYGCHSRARREETLKSFNIPMPPSAAVRPPRTAAPAPPTAAISDAAAPAPRAEPVHSMPSASGEAIAPRSSILEELQRLEAAHASSPSRESAKRSNKGKGKARVTAAQDWGCEADEIPQVCLMSMGAGSVGLNLTVANHVILVDPWWNEPLSAQAINRTHRIGQTKPVIVYRLVSKGTVEHRVVDIATEKMETTTFALSGVKYKGQTLFKGHEMGKEGRMGDLGSLFGMTREEIARLRSAVRRNHFLRR